MTWRLPIGTSDTTFFEYTADAQMIKAYNDDIELQFAYDPNGNRIRKISIADSDTTVLKYTYDGSDLLFEKDGSDAVQIRYLYGPGIDHILESVDSVGTKQHFADALGSVTRITDSNGARQKLMVYDTFGNMYTDSGSVAADYVSYTGREAERDLGIYYYRARYYDPLTGRFMARDPMGFAAGDVNLYRYVGNNPVSLRDPFGLYWGQNYVEAAGMFFMWRNGIGPANYYFGSSSVQARDMQDAFGVTMARYDWYASNYANLRLGAGDPLVPRGSHSAFGLSAFIRAGLNPTEHFLGSYDVCITPNNNGTVTFTVTNTTSMESYGRYLFGNILPWTLPSWERSTAMFYGNIRQTITWTEEIQR